MARGKKKAARKPDAVSLAQANRFDRSALASNHQGQLASSQILRLVLRLASTMLSVIVTIAFGIAWIVLAIVVVPKITFVEQWMSWAGAALMSLLGLFWIIDGAKHLLQDVFPLLRDIIGGRVLMDEGGVSRDYDDTRYPSLWHRLLTWVFQFLSDDQGRHTEWFSGMHYYVLNGQQFVVSQKGYAALTQTSSWRLYYAPHSKRLVNIEPVPGG